MLNLLEEVEKQLPELLEDETAWKSLYVNYESPTVLRLWRLFDNRRIMLHCIEPCDEALYHPHPWPSAVHVLEGTYEMRIGYEHLSIYHAPTVAKLVLPAGFRYEMINPRGWHYVRPLGELSYSTMLVGTRFREIPTKPGKPLESLTDGQRKFMFDKFRTFFPQE